jgi:hypothetical protein
MKTNSVTRSDWEQIVMCEMVIPNTPNAFGDIYTEEATRKFAHDYMKAGLNTNIVIDINHNQLDVTGKVYVIESFIARAGDPDFIEGSWVLAMHIPDPALWGQVLDGTLNGFSFEANCNMQEIEIENLQPRIITGITAPDLVDGHTHTYCVQLDALNRPISGGTGETDGHSHTISTHTYTDYNNGHDHRFNVLTTGENNA